MLAVEFEFPRHSFWGLLHLKCTEVNKYFQQNSSSQGTLEKCTEVQWVFVLCYFHLLLPSCFSKPCDWLSLAGRAAKPLRNRSSGISHRIEAETVERGLWATGKPWNIRYTRGLFPEQIILHEIVNLQNFLLKFEIKWQHEYIDEKKKVKLRWQLALVTVPRLSLQILWNNGL